MSLAAHTPDNSFMGFVAEELNETERLNIQRNKVGNMAVVYGKEASMWKVSVAGGKKNNCFAEIFPWPINETLWRRKQLENEPSSCSVNHYCWVL